MQVPSALDLRENLPGKTPRGFTAFGVFLFFGAIMATLAGATLIWQGTSLGPIWKLNPRAYRQLAPFGRPVGILFLLLGAVMLLAGLGWFRRRLWGWKLAVAVITTQVLGDLINALRGDILGGGLGVAIAGTLLFYLWRHSIRAYFKKSPEQNPDINTRLRLP